MAKIENYSNDTDITNNDRLFGTSVNGTDSETANFKVGELKTFINTGYATTSEVATAKAEAIAAAAADTDSDVSAATSSITAAYQAYADQAETDANAYTDTRETAITSAYQTYTDQAETDANTYTNNKTANNATAINNITHQVIAARAVSTLIADVNDSVVIDFSAVGSDADANTLEYNSTTLDAMAVTPDDGTISNQISADINLKINITALTTTTSSTTITYRIEKDDGNGNFSPIKTFVREKSSGGTSNHVDSFFTYLKLEQDYNIRFTFQASHLGATLNAGSWFEITRI